MGRPDAKVDGPEINARTAENLDHVGLQDDTTTPAVEIMGGPLTDVDAPADLAQQVPHKKAAERAADNQGAARPAAWPGILCVLGVHEVSMPRPHVIRITLQVIIQQFQLCLLRQAQK
jgi:hypothetical protein